MALETRKLGGLLGAALEGANFDAEISDEFLEQLANALYEHQVLAIPAKKLSAAQHLQIARHFGEPEHHDTDVFKQEKGTPHITVVDSEAGDRADAWHCDETFLPQPPIVNVLHAKVLPQHGGDTAFISTALAYEALSDRMKTMLEGLTAQHDFARLFEAGWKSGIPLQKQVAQALLDERESTHPVIMTHPHSGRKWINVNSVYTRFINDLPPTEGQAILEFLLQHLQRPEFSFRHRWQEGDLLLWDQRAVQHYAVHDYSERRLIHRIAVLPR